MPRVAAAMAAAIVLIWSMPVSTSPAIGRIAAPMLSGFTLSRLVRPRAIGGSR